MDSLVYKTYMKDEIVPKTVIFASALGLTIDSFKTADEHGKYPYRIRFYHGNNIVGYMDFVVNESFGKLYPGWEYPFVLFTPIGNVSGYYSSSSHNNLFSMLINDEFESKALYIKYNGHNSKACTNNSCNYIRNTFPAINPYSVVPSDCLNRTPKSMCQMKPQCSIPY